MSALGTQSLISLVVSLLVVARFARRELVERVVRLRTLWIRPVIMLALTVYLVGLTRSVDRAATVEMVLILAVGVVLGAITGLAIVRCTRFAPAAVPAAVRVRGSRVTLVIWIGAFSVRLLAHVLVPNSADLRAQLPLNCGTVAMAASAFIVIAIAFAIEIRRFAGTATERHPGAPLR